MIRRFFQYLIFPYIVSGCIHKSLPEEKFILEPKVKEIPQSVTLEQEIKEQEKLELPARGTRFALFAKIFDLTIFLEYSDLQQAFEIGRLPEKTNIEKAIVIMATLRACLQSGVDATYVEQTSSFQRESSTVQQPWLQSRSVEAASSTLGISLVDELTSNPFLKNKDTYNLVLQILETGNESVNFSLKVHRVLRIYSEQLNDFQQRLMAFENWQKIDSAGHEASSDSLGTSFEDQDDGYAGSFLPSSESVQMSLPYHFNDSDNGDDVLKKSEDLIIQNRYTESIALLKTIRPGSVAYSEASSKIQFASNKAVEDLRKKAARSFQRAIPVTDIKARNVYLLEARKYLLMAVRNFPDSAQLNTVKQNLKVIEKNIELLAPKG